MKPNKLKLITLLLPLTMAAFFGSLLPSQGQITKDAQDQLHNERYRENYENTRGRFYTGKSPFISEKRATPAPEQPPAVKKPAPKPPPAPPSPRVCSEIRTGLIHMVKDLPAEATLGQEFMYELNPTAMGCVAQVVVTDLIPDGTSYVRSEPAATVEGNQLIWIFPTMEDGETQNIKVWLKAETEGQLGSCAMVHALPRACDSIFVGKPVLFLSKSGPETALLGANVPYNITVRNDGSAVARNVVVTDTIPEGLAHSSGQKALRFEVGDLAPKQAKTISLDLKAGQRGRFCNVANAVSSNAGEATAEACTVIVQPGLDIVKTGDKEQYILKQANYQIVVSNTGDTMLKNVVVTDMAPEGTSIAAAPGASVSGNQAVWNIGELAKGEKKSFRVTLVSRQPGNRCNGATVVADGGLRQSSEACTLWKGLSAILIELVDDPDPIQVGETSTYTIRVTNQGTADDRNIVIIATYPNEMTPIAAQGGAIDGQTVSFPAVPRLAPKQSFTYTIQARGANVGDARISVKMTTEDLTSPVTEEESTRIY